MRKIMLMVIVLTPLIAIGQTFNEKITKEYVFEKRSAENTVIVSNISGDITVVGYDGDKIMLEVVKTIKGKTETRLERGKQEVKLGVVDRADTLIFYIEDGCNSFGKSSSKKNRNNGWDRGGWGYDWNCNDRDCGQEYDYTMDFTLKVPFNVSLLVSTINEGDVSVSKVNGAVTARNVNGSIRLTDLVREANASTINGDVDVDYSTAPAKECRFYTLNGDINALFPKGLAAELSFESFNGEFYTNIDKIESLPISVQKSSDEKGLKYKVAGNRYQVGKGGVFLDFETFNGNVYLKEKI